MQSFKLNETDILSNQDWTFPTNIAYGPGRLKEIGGICNNLDIKESIDLNRIKTEFNAKCRESVLRYTQEWIDMSKRIGFWLDMENSYVTMSDNYIESVWWSLKRLYEKGLIYKGTRVAPYCSRCGTTLSSHELAQGYKEVKDPAVYVKFEAEDDDFKYLAWTTTPWTLISNVLLSVNPEYDYVVVDYNDEKLLMAEGLVKKVLEFEVLPHHHYLYLSALLPERPYQYKYWVLSHQIVHMH